ncbi:rhomboid family intramembrane serine protease [Chloracidobacterium sp. MS 40/45]|uniref:rhomboid family intramembrane serine protease n=1 Tax=Chloracidobacterium aggregatum TaxID=2851959 RepID=UPI001B8D7466|nr:rhomboid family intramembrane serine protease [Chloracidobacterium aggregatum]QUV99134.1 rhomboid family intramembrane serine protease [Chloracidobacterium sp. MS 40/45]
MRRVFDDPPVNVGGPLPGTLFLMAATTVVVIVRALVPVPFFFLPEAVLNGAVWQFFTATITPLTPFGWLIGLLVLYLFGNVVERMLGTGRFLALCFLGGAAAYLGTFLMALVVRQFLPSPLPSFVFAASSATLFSLMVGVFAARLWNTPTFFNFVLLRGRTIFYVSAAIDIVFLLYGYPDSVSALWALGIGFLTIRGGELVPLRATWEWVTGPWRRWRIRRKYKNFRVVEAEMQRMWDELEERMNREDRGARRPGGRP